MKQGQFLNLSALTSTRRMRTLHRARIAAAVETSDTCCQLGRVTFAKPAVAPGDSQTPSPEHSRVKPAVNHWDDQIELPIRDEDRKLLFPSGLDRCPGCGVAPHVEVQRGLYRVACANSTRAWPAPNGPPLCQQPPGAWTRYLQDAIHLWNLTCRLTK